MSVHEHDDECGRALSRLQEFLHGELAVTDADLIRAHLDACEKCLDEFDLENAITALVRRCHPPIAASSTLRMRVVQVSMTLRQG